MILAVFLFSYHADRHLWHLGIDKQLLAVLIIIVIIIIIMIMMITTTTTTIIIIIIIIIINITLLVQNMDVRK